MNVMQRQKNGRGMVDGGSDSLGMVWLDKTLLANGQQLATLKINNTLSYYHIEGAKTRM
jgi:hypothetical protein